MTTVTAKLPPDLSAWLTREAKSRRTSKSKIIRETLEMVRNMKGVPESTSFFDVNSDLLGVFAGPREAAAYAAKATTTSAEKASSVFGRLIARLAERFAPQVSEKVVAMGVLVVGALGGATVNCLFIDHFQSIAHGHFTVRRLERKYGEEEIRKAYEKLAEDRKRRR